MGRPPGCLACTGTRCGRCWPTRFHPAIVEKARHGVPILQQAQDEPFTGVINAILECDTRVPRKQRHTAKRIFERLRDEYGFDGQYTIVKDHVREHQRRTVARILGDGQRQCTRSFTRASVPLPVQGPVRPTGQGQCQGGGAGHGGLCATQLPGTRPPGGEFRGVEYPPGAECLTRLDATLKPSASGWSGIWTPCRRRQPGHFPIPGEVPHQRLLGTGGIWTWFR